MVDTEISSKALIELVEARSQLWDKTTDNYKNRIATKLAWHEISAALIPDYLNLDKAKQQFVTKLVMQKWTHIRDNYIKFQKKNKDRKRSGSKPVKPYVHSKRMKFLDKIVFQDDCFKTKDSNTSNDESEDSVDWKRFAERQRNKTKRKADATKPTEVKIAQPIESIPPSNNRHMSFFQGILPTLEYFDDNEVLEFQMGVLQLLKGIKSSRQQIQSDPIDTSQDVCFEVKEEIV